MESIYDALYNYAQNRQDLTRWLHDEDIVKDYQECLEYSTRQEKQLMEALDDPQAVRDLHRKRAGSPGLRAGDVFLPGPGHGAGAGRAGLQLNSPSGVAR